MKCDIWPTCRIPVTRTDHWKKRNAQCGVMQGDLRLHCETFETRNPTPVCRRQRILNNYNKKKRARNLTRNSVPMRPKKGNKTVWRVHVVLSFGGARKSDINERRTSPLEIHAGSGSGQSSSMDHLLSGFGIMFPSG